MSPPTFQPRLVASVIETRSTVSYSADVSRHAPTYGDGDVISTPAGFRRHLVGKTPINVCHCDIAEIRSVGKLVTVPTFLISQRIEFRLK